MSVLTPYVERLIGAAGREVMTTRFMMIGGFLGAGKTTAILRLAQRHVSAGNRVGIIANDLGRGLVDTQTYLAHGLPVEEMAGVCFACRFEDLIAAAGRLQDGHQPDVLLAEPAGSCTDIVSRVIEPLKRVYPDRFHVAPYVTLLDPQRAQQALGRKGPGGFSAKVTFLYKMQQNEADVVAINKVDMLSPDQTKVLRELVGRNFPKAEIITVSARTGEGFEQLTAVLEAGRPAGGNPLPAADRCSERSSAGDAQLAWLNGTWQVTAAEAFEIDALLLDLARTIQSELVRAGAEPAHVKLVLQSEDALAVANVLNNQQAPELSHAAGVRVTDARLIINARVETRPGTLRRCVNAAVSQATGVLAPETACLSLTSRAPALYGEVGRQATSKAE